MWTEIHSQNKNIVQTHHDFIAGKKAKEVRIIKKALLFLIKHVLFPSACLQ